MAGTNKIFKDLQDFAVDPPPGFFAKLWKKIRGARHADDHLTQAEFSGDDSAIDYSKLLSELRSYTDKDNAPPSFDDIKIAALTSLQKKDPLTEPLKKNATFSLLYKIAAAAIFTGAAFIIYYNISSKETTDQRNGIANITIADSNKTNTTATVHSNNITGADSIFIKEKTAVANNENFVNKVFKNTYPARNVKVSNYYNDFIYMFTNFRYEQARTFLSDIKKNQKISLNSYSYVNVSDKMASFLKKMYAVNRKNKPTRKAKKMKAKLAKWKKKDEANFDKNLKKNPMDILDLSEFILKK